MLDFKKLLGLNNEDDGTDEGEETYSEAAKNEEKSERLVTVTPIPRNGNQANKNLMKVVIKEPKVFKDAYGIADELTMGRQVIINLEHSRDGQRIIDFISGTVYAISGQSRQVGKYIFVFTPKTMEIKNSESPKDNARRAANANVDYPNGFHVDMGEDGE